MADLVVEVEKNGLSQYEIDRLNMLATDQIWEPKKREGGIRVDTQFSVFIIYAHG